VVNFEQVWANILKNQGQKFYTKTNLEFIYSVNGNILKHNRTDYSIEKGDFIKAFELLPIEKPSDIINIVRGPSYVWAILNDIRIIK